MLEECYARFFRSTAKQQYSYINLMSHYCDEKYNMCTVTESHMHIPDLVILDKTVTRPDLAQARRQGPYNAS